MKAITQFQADDGSVWTDEEQAKERDWLCRAVADVLSEFPPRNEDGLRSGRGYQQHTRENVLRLQQGLARLTSRYQKSHHIDWVMEADRPAGGTFIGRILSDSDRLQPISRAWVRIECIDDQYREWEQPYFTRHPEPGASVVNSTAEP